MLKRRTLVASGAAAISVPARAEESFDAFLNGVRAEARRAGIRDATLQQAFAGVQPIPRVIELDRKQPEFTLTWPEYRARVLPEARLRAARESYQAERALLDRVEARYRVDPHVIVGIWGIESNFGANQGSYRLMESLSTLAWEGRRASYFRAELLNALRILDNGDVSAARMTGGWAGAMGQPQFMPSSYVRLAVDFDGDGRRDIWDSRADVFGSVANYLARNGWRAGEPWGQPVTLPAGFDAASAGRDTRADDGRLASYGLTSGGFVLWVGTIEPRKNVGALIDAFARLDRPGAGLGPQEICQQVAIARRAVPAQQQFVPAPLGAVPFGPARAAGGEGHLACRYREGAVAHGGQRAHVADPDLH